MKNGGHRRIDRHKLVLAALFSKIHPPENLVFVLPSPPQRLLA